MALFGEGLEGFILTGIDYKRFDQPERCPHPRGFHTPRRQGLSEEMNKMLKWRLLRYLPGKTGRYYERRFQLRYARDVLFPKTIKKCRGKTYIDLGANVGEYTKKMAQFAGKVIAFEPDPWALDELRGNVKNLKNVKIEEAAAGTSAKMVFLYRHVRFDEDPAFYSESSSIVVDKDDISAAEAFEVRQINFIRYLEDLDEDIGILKIDIEGAEVDLLEAMFDRPDILCRIDYIFAETHEYCIPEHRSRVEALRDRAKQIKQPYINLWWT